MENVQERDWQKAVDAYESQDYAGALFVYKKIAKYNAEALVAIGNIYEWGGGGVEQDYLEAKKWYEKSIDTINDPKAHLGLGRLYYLGLGVGVDCGKSLYHFGLIEECDEPGALFALGCIYYDGLGVPVDEERAIAYFQGAIKLGHLLATRRYASIKIKRGEWLSGIALWVKTTVKIIAALSRKSNSEYYRLGI